MIRNKTYHNFMTIKNKLIKEKGYSAEEASSIAHRIFENVEFDKDYGKRPAEAFYNMVLSAPEYKNCY